MNSNDDLLVAHGYREQVQGRTYESFEITPKFLRDFSSHIRRVYSTFLSEEDPIEELALYLEQNHPDAKIPIEELSDFLKSHGLSKDSLIYEYFCSGLSKFDDGLSISHLYKTKDKIDEACKDLGMNLRGGVSLGQTNSLGLQAEQQPVFLTEASIVNISQNLNFIAYSLAKLLGKSIYKTKHKDNQFTISKNLHDHISHLLNNSELQSEWTNFFLYASLNLDKPFSAPMVTLPDQESATCVSDIYDAISYFIVGHEYAHHIFEHSLEGTASAEREDFELSHQKEMTADLAALHISISIGVKEPFNLFATSNIGALAILTVIERIKEGNAILLSGNSANENPSISDHPPLETRVKLIKGSLAYYIGSEEALNTATSYLEVFSKLLDFIWSNVEECLIDHHRKGVRPEEKKAEWLPL